MSDDIMRACMKNIHEILRLKQLNVELLENLELTMLWLKDYHEKTKAPIPNIEKLKSLLTKTDHLIDEICFPMPFLQPRKQTQELSDEILQEDKSDEDLTEPGLLFMLTCGLLLVHSPAQSHGFRMRRFNLVQSA